MKRWRFTLVMALVAGVVTGFDCPGDPIPLGETDLDTISAGFGIALPEASVLVRRNEGSRSYWDGSQRIPEVTVWVVEVPLEHELELDGYALFSTDAMLLPAGPAAIARLGGGELPGFGAVTRLQWQRRQDRDFVRDVRLVSDGSRTFLVLTRLHAR